MKLDIERLGWIRSRWSGFSLLIDPELDDLGPAGGGAMYTDAAIVLGFWVYQIRIWVLPEATDK